MLVFHWAIASTAKHPNGALPWIPKGLGSFCAICGSFPFGLKNSGKTKGHPRIVSPLKDAVIPRHWISVLDPPDFRPRAGGQRGSIANNRFLVGIPGKLDNLRGPISLDLSGFAKKCQKLFAPQMSHNQNPVLKRSTQNHASRTKKADIRSDPNPH